MNDIDELEERIEELEREINNPEPKFRPIKREDGDNIVCVDYCPGPEINLKQDNGINSFYCKRSAECQKKGMRVKGSLCEGISE